MLSLIGSAMDRELSTGIDVFLSALRKAGPSTDSVSDDQPPEFLSFQEEEEIEELDEVTLIEERLATGD